MATNHSIFETMLVEDGFTVQAAGYKKSLQRMQAFLDAAYRNYSRNLTVTPDLTFLPKSLASQLVKRIQPCDAVLEMADGFGVP